MHGGLIVRIWGAGERLRFFYPRYFFFVHVYAEGELSPKAIHKKKSCGFAMNLLKHNCLNSLESAL